MVEGVIEELKKGVSIAFEKREVRILGGTCGAIAGDPATITKYGDMWDDRERSDRGNARGT
jgi:hypothetical protein